MSFPKYPSYKDSGVEWLGEIPEHWEVAPLKFYASCNDSTLPETTDEDYEIEYVEISDVDEIAGIKGSSSYRFSEAPSRARRIVQEGDILVSTVRTYLRAIAPVSDPADNLIASTGFAVIRPRTKYLDGKFTGYLLRAEWWISEVIARSVGVSYPAINSSDLIALKVPAPRMHEQTQIARFLDHEIARIDALVEEQQRLIELLKEKRQAVISHTVTKGLNPSVPMKDSGVKWLGEVPAHWVVQPLMSLTAPSRAIMYGIVLPGENVEVGIPIVKGGDVKPGRLELDRLCRTTKEIEAPFARARLRPNDIVYSIRGTIGDAELVPDELHNANITQDVARISPQERIDIGWLLYVMKSNPVFSQLEQRSLGAAVRGINICDLKRARVPVPPEKEQAEIAKSIELNVSSLNELMAEATSGVELLKEHRSALISAAVTGKIDLRGWQPPASTPAPIREQETA